MLAEKEKYPPEVKEQLHNQLEKLFFEEWGGPRSEMALTYLRENVIPHLMSCLITNHHYLENNTFIDILANKLNTEFAYPPAFAEGLSVDITKIALAVLGRHEMPESHPWHPWEVILRMLTIGNSINQTAIKTDFPEAYIEVFRKRYLTFSKLVQREDIKYTSYQQLPELSGYSKQLIWFMEDFQKRFKIFKNYYARLQAEQVIFDLQLPMDADNLLRLLEGLYYEEGNFTPEEMIVELSNGGETKTKFSGILSDKNPQQVEKIMDKLLEKHLLVKSSNDNSLLLAPEGARLVTPLLVPRLVKEISYNLQADDVNGRLCSATLLTGKNTEIIVQVIRELVRQRQTEAVGLFEVLINKVSKPVLLEIIAGCGVLGGNSAIEILTRALQHRDSMVRVKTCQSIGNLGYQCFFFHLINALKDNVTLVRENAVNALGKLGMQSAVRHLEAVQDDLTESNSVQQAAREALLEIQNSTQ